MVGCKPIDTPIEANYRLGKKQENEEPVNRGIYWRIVGKLIYLSHTRPDIAYVVSVVSQFMHATLKPDLEVVYRIVEYLKGRKGILFQKSGEFKLEAYTDSWLYDRQKINYGVLHLLRREFGHLEKQETTNGGLF